MYNRPLAYFITFSTYGTWLHGEEKGSIWKDERGTIRLPLREELQQSEEKKLKVLPVCLEAEARRIVIETVIKHCQVRQWRLWACHVRSNHLHIVAGGREKPEKMMSEFKAWATRALRERGYAMEKVWTKHGSTVYLFEPEKVKEKAHYVVYEQGEMMEYYVDEELHVV